ncbi:MAG TPA: hypothetical protein VLE70_07435 [Anaerolineae bacterium]|jgi:hypothetical protein|nr:hypothetical protein [Anaerolineae bacterium]
MSTIFGHSPAQSESRQVIPGHSIILFSLFILSPLFFMLPGALRLGKHRPTSFDGVVTVDDAIAACRRTRLRGWALVAFAQRMVYRKFAIYGTRNLWDSPARAFEHGIGYCTQYNLALKQILDGLGFETRAVFCLKVRVLDDGRWTMGHTWLRVTIDGEKRDVCAGGSQNGPGRNRFAPLWPVLPGPRPLLFLTHLGLILFCAFVEWKAVLTGRPAPYWTYIER